MFYLDKHYKGSFTIEAAILVPMILFLLLAIIYLLFFMHDRLRMLSYGQRRCEDILWERENPGEETGALMMEIHISDEGVNDTILEQAAGFVQSCQRAEVCMTGRILTEVNGSRPFLGRELTTEVSVGSIRIDYAADWFKKRMWEKTGE